MTVQATAGELAQFAPAQKGVEPRMAPTTGQRAQIMQATMSMATPSMTVGSGQKYHAVGTSVASRAGAEPKMMVSAGSLGASATYLGASNTTASVLNMSHQS